MVVYNSEIFHGEMAQHKIRHCMKSGEDETAEEKGIACGRMRRENSALKRDGERGETAK